MDELAWGAGVIHTVEPDDETLHGYFSRDRAAVVTIQPGDTVRFRTLDTRWCIKPYTDPKQTETARHPAYERDPVKDHALCGAVAVQGAKPGMTLQIDIGTIRPGAWGWTKKAGYRYPYFELLGVEDAPDELFVWRIDADAGTATTHSGYTVSLSPFMGVMGLAPAKPGLHPTTPPRAVGGNMDCKELVSGTSLFLPVEVEGGLFSTGDGHGAQGDGEVSGTAVECPMERVDLTFHIRDDWRIETPHARTPTGWLTMGFHLNMQTAMFTALRAMLALMQREFGMSPGDAFGLASVAVDLRITQIVNNAVGVHAFLPHGAIR